MPWQHPPSLLSQQYAPASVQQNWFVNAQQMPAQNSPVVWHVPFWHWNAPSHVPQLPPQPSGPQVLPAQSGWQQGPSQNGLPLAPQGPVAVLAMQAPAPQSASLLQPLGSRMVTDPPQMGCPVCET